MTLISAEFDDIYFSKENGLAETDYVFIEASQLLSKWKDKNHYTIFETGFGTGLNCLRAASLFKQTCKPSQKLNIISVEKYPLKPSQIKQALNEWESDLSPYLDRLMTQYPLRIEGIHSIRLDQNINLLLCIGEISDVLKKLFSTTKYSNQQKILIDTWFLDGFAPAKNPDMWSDTLFEHIRNHSHNDTTLSTFTASGLVKRGLESTGLKVSKIRGYGKKRDMLIAEGHDGLDAKSQQKAKPISNVAIIGGGLAGTALAYYLRIQNIPHVIFEQGPALAQGASGNPLGLINPKLTAKPSAEGDFYTSAYNTLLRTFLSDLKDHPQIESHQIGSIHLNISDDKNRRFHGYLNNLNWHQDHLHHLNKEDTSALLGIKTEYDSIHFPDATSINPQALCHAYAKHSNILFNTTIKTIEHNTQEWILTDQNDVTHSASHLVIACADGAKRLAPLQNLPIHTVRGQITLVEDHSHLQNLPKLLCFGGYMSPYSEDLNGHVLGASYKHWDDSNDLKREDDQMNIDRLNDIIPDLIDADKTRPLRASQRLSSKDRIPLIGQYICNDYNQAPPLYTSLAHGSHGLISSAIAAKMITAEIEQSILPLYPWSIDKISPNRFRS